MPIIHQPVAITTICYKQSPSQMYSLTSAFVALAWLVYTSWLLFNRSQGIVQIFSIMQKIILEHIEEYIIMIWTKIGKRYKTIVKYVCAMYEIENRTATRHRNRINNNIIQSYSYTHMIEKNIQIYQLCRLLIPIIWKAAKLAVSIGKTVSERERKLAPGSYSVVLQKLARRSVIKSNYVVNPLQKYFLRDGRRKSEYLSNQSKLSNEDQPKYTTKKNDDTLTLKIYVSKRR
ncbi:hypothetical protein AGLY_002966 [Aphis glycines]|uniref:Uncharacterized protein n=1 Tax=Aphis glycines TaxID=307491 RepID=A0A6G0U1T3_APHGL|nr:hypothetical protein AGLY_002966 [Aphis glycines]